MEELTHIYDGPTTGYGLKQGTLCSLTKTSNTAAGCQMGHIVDAKGKAWIVRRKHVKAAW